mgnify:CR=1 FL=1
MTAVMTRTDPARCSTPAGFSNDDERWQAEARRDPAADGEFYLLGADDWRSIAGPRARRAGHDPRERPIFHATTRRCRAGRIPALQARCRPDAARSPNVRPQRAAIARRAIQEAEQMCRGLDDLAKAAGMSRFHFHRVFKSPTGVTPKAHADAHRAQRVRDELHARLDRHRGHSTAPGSTPPGASTGPRPSFSG